jgi:hypothetical protein
MANFAGYANGYSTPYGIANFWIVSDFHFQMNNVSGLATMVITLNGFPTEADCTAGSQPIGTYTITLSQQQIFTMFGGAQPLMQAAIVASSPAWADATYVPASA